jgi:DNA gyrase subunit A
MIMNTEKIINKNIADELKESYIDYAMSVIVGRAIPDVRDGLKPVHRRIIYSMFKNNAIYNQNKDKDSQNFLKSARIVGDILGKYHPHGDQAIYDSMVRLAQNFSIRYPLVLGKGNFGSLTGLPAGHMRYTEAVLDSISNEIIEDINKDTVDFMPNYDESLEEPKYLPSKLPTLLLNGSSGIAVGMSTNMAPHNLTEVCNAIIATIDNPNISIKELSKIIKGPDFPTGGIIINPKGILDAYKTGRGKIIIRGKISV